MAVKTKKFESKSGITVHIDPSLNELAERNLFPAQVRRANAVMSQLAEINRRKKGRSASGRFVPFNKPTQTH